MSLCRVTCWLCWCYNLQVITKATREFYTYTCDNSHTGQKYYTEKHIPNLRNTWSSRKRYRCTTEKLWFAQTNTSCRVKNYFVLLRRKHIEIRMEKKSSFSGSDSFLYYLDVRIFLTGSIGNLLPSTRGDCGELPGINITINHQSFPRAF